MNEVILGDCIEKLRDIEEKSIDLIYLDPPFFTQKEHKLSDKENNSYSFDDKWESIHDYKTYISDRLIECRRVLKDTGSIFLHCDKSASHYLRVALDEVFGSDNFQSEIIWSYKRWSNSKKGLLNSHQNIYFYSKTDEFKFNTFYNEYSATTNVDQILQKRKKDKNGKSTYMLDENRDVVVDDNKKGVPLGDVWNIPYLNPRAKERCGYPTQKPILLLDQIIKISTDENDVVLDPFCGSGTTLVSAKLLNRNFIGIDKSESAVNLANKRLENSIKTESKLLKKGEKSYKNKTDDELNILKLFNAIPVQRNKYIDGIVTLKEGRGLVAVKIQKDDESIEDLIKGLKKAGEKKKCKNMILVRTKKEDYQLSMDNRDIIIVDRYNLVLEDIANDDM